MRIAQWVVALPKPKQIVGTEKWWSPIKKRGGCTNEFPVRYAFFVMVRVRYVGTWFELKIPDFSHIEPAFCMQRQKTAKAEVKCVN